MGPLLFFEEGLMWPLIVTIAVVMTLWVIVVFMVIRKASR